MRVMLHDTLTGDFVAELKFSGGTWSSGICRADSVSVTLPGYIGEKLADYMIPRKFSISVSDDSRRVLAAGVLGKPVGEDDEDGMHSVTMPGQGIEVVFQRWSVLPFPFSPLVDSEGYPITYRDTRITGVEYGTMMKRLYQQGMSHPGGDLPVLFEPDRAGTREKEWQAVSGKSVQGAVEDISNLEGGVEWDWVATLNDSDRLTWSLVTGTDSVPEISSSFWHTWQLGGSKPDIRKFSSEVDPEFMASSVVFTGGKEDDSVMVSYASDPTLLDAGLPWSMIWDSSHSSVSIQATLDGWAQQALARGQAPVQYWGFEVRACSALGLRHGDWCTVEASNHWLVPDGTYTRRVVEVSGTIGSDWVRVVVAGEMSWPT